MIRSAMLCAALALSSAAFAQGTIKIAILGPMAFVQGENHWAGAEMARDEINKAGGINVGGKRMRIELVRADTNEIQSVPDATNAIERVITRDKADFLIGGFRSEAVLAMQEVAMDYKKILRGARAEENLLVVHRHFLHRQHRLGAEAADQEIGLVAGDDALDGVGGVGHRLDLVGVGADQLDLHALAADVDAARLVDLVARHLGAGQVVLSLHEGHRPEDRDLDGALRERSGRQRERS